MKILQNILRQITILISEYAGLFIASSKWQFKESEKWNRYSQKGLENEIIKQHSKNGINKEEAAEYIQFITDFFFCHILLEKTQTSIFRYNLDNNFIKSSAIFMIFWIVMGIFRNMVMKMMENVSFLILMKSLIISDLC